MATAPESQFLLEGQSSLSITEKDLVIYGAAPQKDSSTTTKGDNDKAQFIPLYNVLWAESSDGVLTVDYVRVTKNHVKLQKIRLPLNKTETEANNEPDPQSLVATILAKAYQGTKLRKRVLVLVNPHAGPGGGVKRWTQEVKPLFRAARLEMEVIILTRGGEATDLAEKMDIDKFDAVIPCSGDGTPHEVFNGLGKRKDAQEALRKIAVGHIPCGSGNALSWNLYGSNKADIAALSVIKGVVMPIDLTSVTQGSTRILSFLSQAVGIIAESDLATEHMRWMGATRFEVGLVMRVFQRKCYPCDLAVKVEVEDKAGVKAHYKRHIQSEALAESNGVSEEHVEGLPALKYGTVEDKLPEGWELVPQDKIGNFYCGNMAYMSTDANFFPAALPSDGCMDLVTMRGDLSPFAATKTLLAVESGKFFDMPTVSYRKISAYRIIPRNQEDGYISIDGERVPFEPFQAEIHRKLGRVLSKSGKFEAAGPRGWESAGD